MKAWLIQIKREFWEHQTLFVFIPLTIAAIIIIAGTYVVALDSSLDSKAGKALFGHVFFIDSDDDSGNPADSQGDGDTTQEYVIDFSKGELVRAEKSDTGISISSQQQQILNNSLYGLHIFIMIITGFVLMFYQLNCLYADRKDRSILFWKSLPVSERRNVASKFIISLLAVPLLVSLISWGVQLCYLVLSSIYVYRVGSNPWEIVWGRLDLLHVFPQELIFFLWSMAWWLPLNAWLMLASALGKRSPFLVATVPVVVVIIMENLLFDSWNIGKLLLAHIQAVGVQASNLRGDELNGILNTGSVNIFLDIPAMIAGLVTAGILFPAIVWLRNHRFEI